MHNFNFPVVNFSHDFIKKDFKNIVIIPYHYHQGKLIYNQSIFNKLIYNSSTVLDNLIDKACFTFSYIENITYFIFVHMNLDNIEQSVVNCLKSIPDTYVDIQFFLNDYYVYDKLLISKVLFELKHNWSLKTDVKEKSQLYITFVISQQQKYLTNHGYSLAHSQAITQQLVDMPSNYLTPDKFASFIEHYIQENSLQDKIKIKIYGQKELEKLNMGALLAVAKGSKEEPKMIVLEYKQGKYNKPPVVLVGKGVTFDSGGISIKPSNSMLDMKGDMAGAATALCSVIYAAKAHLPINVVAIAVCCENMPSGNALKPGDVVTSSNGTTIEVVDTDAEGRLILADALDFSKKFKGIYTIDMATLTGACITALGYTHTGLFTQDTKLAHKLLSAGKKIQDIAWQLPLDYVHEDMLDSKIADISNLCIGKGAGAQNGAVFLQRFAPEKGWCHLDIAGTAYYKGKGATSRPLALISEFLDRHV